MLHLARALLGMPFPGEENVDGIQAAARDASSLLLVRGGLQGGVQLADDVSAVVLVDEPACGELGLELAGGVVGAIGARSGASGASCSALLEPIC